MAVVTVHIHQFATDCEFEAGQFVTSETLGMDGQIFLSAARAKRIWSRSKRMEGKNRRRKQRAEKRGEADRG